MPFGGEEISISLNILAKCLDRQRLVIFLTSLFTCCSPLGVNQDYAPGAWTATQTPDEPPTISMPHHAYGHSLGSVFPGYLSFAEKTRDGRRYCWAELEMRGYANALSPLVMAATRPRSRYSPQHTHQFHGDGDGDGASFMACPPPSMQPERRSWVRNARLYACHESKKYPANQDIPVGARGHGEGKRPLQLPLEDPVLMQQIIEKVGGKVVRKAEGSFAVGAVKLQ